jgi:hypothetical protein
MPLHLFQTSSLGDGMTVPMKGTHKTHVAFGLVGAVATASAMFGAIAACSSNSSNAAGDGGGSTAANCTTTNQLIIQFSPMYSAYEPSNTYKLPVIANVANATLTVSDPSAVGIQSNPDLTNSQYTGWTLQMLKAPNPSADGGAGSVTLTVTAQGYCNSAQLYITAATADDWQIGNQRYNNGMSIHIPMFGGADGGRPMGPPPMMTQDGSFFETAEGGPACTSCHGMTATNFILKDIAHTPEQTGGFSDNDLVNIIVNGVVPPGGYFDPNIISMMNWHSFHQWSDIQPDQYKGMVVYLRSLTPVAQMGSVNFNGFGPPMGDGGAAGSGD